MRLFFSSNVFYSILLLLLGTILYFPILDNGFSKYAADDDWMLYENDYVFSLSFENVREYFTEFYYGQYSPVNTLAYGVIYYFYGISPKYYHAFSLILHLGNVLLALFLFKHLRLLRGKNTLTEESDPMNHPMVPFITALLFLIHPMQVESVAWISASKVLLYSFFFLSSLVLYLAYISTFHKRYYFLTIVFFIISFGAKEQAVVFPLVLILVDWYLERDIRDGKVILEKAPFFLLSMGFSLISIIAQNTGFSYKLANEYYPLADRIFLACYALTEYIFKLLVPLKLSAWYKFPIDPGENIPLKYYLYPGLILFLIIFLWQFWKDKRYWIIFGIAFFIVNIILSLHIIPMARGVLMADRYVYIGSIGIFYIVATYLVDRYQKSESQTKRILIVSTAAQQKNNFPSN